MADFYENPLFFRSAAVAENAFGVQEAKQDKPLKDASELDPLQKPAGETGPSSLASLLVRALGPNQPEAARTLLHKHAQVYYKLRKYSEAEALYRQSLAIAGQVPSEKDTELASILNNLARLCQDQRRYEEALRLYQRSLAIVEEVFGPVHPKVAKRLRNLAELYRAQGRNSEADRLSVRLRELRELLQSERNHRRQAF